MAETPLQRKMQKVIRDRGGYVFKVHGSEYMPSGLPDLIVCYRGYYLGIEVKDPSAGKNTTRVRQLYIHQKIREAGGIVRVARSVQEVIVILDGVDVLENTQQKTQD